MLKISRLTDYGLLAMVYLARKGDVATSREIADFYSLSVPMVSKVLKVLHDGGVVVSQRGIGGGYALDRDPESVSLGELLAILEGPWDLVECETFDESGHATCQIRSGCPSRGFMFGINRAIKNSFDQITLAELTRGTFPLPELERPLPVRRQEGLG